MAVIDPTKGRAKITHTETSTKIELPVKKSAPHLIFLFICFWVWLMGETAALNSLWNRGYLEPISFYSIVFLILWTTVGVLVALALVWILVGAEVITCSASRLNIAMKIHDLGVDKEYEVQSISNLRYLTFQYNFNFRRGRPPWQAWNLSGGQIAFDYELKTIRFGINLEESEARYIVEQLRIRDHIRRED